MKAFFIALQFLTRLPTPQYPTLSEQDMGKSVLFYPIVGAIIGLLLAGLDYFISALPNSLTAFIILMVSILINGALHLDGLADSADAWLAGGNKEQSLQIMSDPTNGTAGTVAISLLLLGKYVLLVELVNQHYGWVLLLAPIIARTTPIIMMLSTPYVRTNGIAHSIMAQLPKKMAWLIVLSILFIALLLLPIALFWVLTTLWLIRRLAIQRLGGFTGDTLGATVELSEFMLFFGFILTLYL